MSDHPLIIFGLDGACFDLIRPWIKNGHIPTINEILDTGVSSKLESCVPATTPPAWTSLTTGVNPGKHGIFGFYSRTKGSYDLYPVSDTDVYARRLWDYTSESDLTSLVVNVPVTHPPRELDGALVPGYMADNDVATYPDGLLTELGFEDYSVYAESEADMGQEEQLRDEWLNLTESRRDLTLALMAQYDWDVLFLEFQKTDGAVHKFSDSENMRAIFERVDDCMSDVLEAVEDEPNVVLVSDHGIGQTKDWSIALNTWLEERGYIKTSVDGGGDDGSWIDRKTSSSSEDAGDGTIFDRLGELASRAGITKQGVERILSALGLYNVAARRAPDRLLDMVAQEAIDRQRSEAFYEGMGFSGVDVGVIVNDERFYPDGAVTEAEYDEVRSRLIEEIRSLEGPTGKPFQRILTREEVYDGPRVEYAPDIILEQAPRYVIGSKNLRGQTFIPAEPGRIDHTRHGIFAATGPDISDDWSPEEPPSIMDVTPTLLYLQDVPVNTRIDGTIHEPLVTDDRDPNMRQYDRYEPAAGRTEQNEGELKDRLQAMGYLK
ncbi:alkaline phosphatase family protein [Halorientalis marina]|uniref:alkaline phosphatase family protein n=1 Tax=Halorientalis marina TaxID=2931976 RepID=UPI001FF1013B|nr:alkaline phosphatase family protein [Halorientalis marina]